MCIHSNHLQNDFILLFQCFQGRVESFVVDAEYDAEYRNNNTISNPDSSTSTLGRDDVRCQISVSKIQIGLENLTLISKNQISV